MIPPSDDDMVVYYESDSLGVDTLTYRTNDLEELSTAEQLFRINPVGVDSANSLVETEDILLGYQLTVAVTLMDDQATRIVGGASNFSAMFVSGENDQTALGAFVEQSDGHYTATYKPVNAGVDCIEITYEKQPLAGGPFPASLKTNTGSLEVVSGDGQTHVIPTDTTQSALRVRVRDKNGEPMPGVTVRYKERGAQQQVEKSLLLSPQVVTDSAGYAQTLFKAGEVVGQVKVSVRVLELPRKEFGVTVETCNDVTNATCGPYNYEVTLASYEPMISKVLLLKHSLQISGAMRQL